VCESTQVSFEKGWGWGGPTPLTITDTHTHWGVGTLFRAESEVYYGAHGSKCVWVCVRECVYVCMWQRGRVSQLVHTCSLLFGMSGNALPQLDTLFSIFSAKFYKNDPTQAHKKLILKIIISVHF